jgi:hypothetical protein
MHSENRAACEKYRDRQTMDDNINIVSFELPYSTLCVNFSGRQTTINFTIWSSKFPIAMSDSIPFLPRCVNIFHAIMTGNTLVGDFKVLTIDKKNRCLCGLPNFLVSWYRFLSRRNQARGLHSHTLVSKLKVHEFISRCLHVAVLN